MSNAIYNRTAGRLHTALTAEGVCMFNDGAQLGPLFH